MTKQLNINIDSTFYEVHIGRRLLDSMALKLKNSTKNEKVLIVTDDLFVDTKIRKLEAKLTSQGFDCNLYIMKGGKTSKSIAELVEIYRILEDKNFSRDATLIAVGGGVIGDLGGFAASTWYRGMNLFHVPTTMMAMVDSSIGGKVAINFRETINAIGNYYHPISNFMDLEFIDTLSDKDYLSGISEVIKCGLIADCSFLEWLEENSAAIISRQESYLEYIISKAIEIKVAHVNGDLKEGNKRLLLNFGHTIGHAIEMATHTDAGETYRHGEGVALGMVAAMLIAKNIKLVKQIEVDRVIGVLKKYKLPVYISASSIGFVRENLVKNIFNLCFRDKKRKDNKLRFILLDEVGMASVHSDITVSTIKDVIDTIVLD